MPWTVVLNPVAGRVPNRDLAPALRAVIAQAGLDAEVVVSTSAAVAAETGRRLAIVPTGAGNDFAAALGYERARPLDAIAAIAGGRDATVDLGMVNGRWYT